MALRRCSPAAHSDHQDVEYLKQLKDASDHLVHYLQEVEEKFAVSTEQFNDACAILKGWKAIFALVKEMPHVEKFYLKKEKSTDG